MRADVFPMWLSVPADIDARVHRCLDSALEKAPPMVTVFFRADDVAVPGTRFNRLAATFTRNRMPLNLAVVPAWLTGPRWQTVRRLAKQVPGLFCWHQHGWRHVNHEPAGKKQEFGPARSRREIKTDLLRGRQRLARIMGRDFFPVFTPPWNRCDGNTLALLSTLEYLAVSRSSGSLPPSPEKLADIPVNVDLHTLREKNPDTGWNRLLADLGCAVSGGICGVMIHHRFMNDAAFGFLDMLLKAVAQRRRFYPVTFKELTVTRNP